MPVSPSLTIRTLIAGLVLVLAAGVAAPAAAAVHPPAAGAVISAQAGPPRAACAAMAELAVIRSLQKLDRVMLAGGRGASAAFHRAVPALRRWLQDHRKDLPRVQRKATRHLIAADAKGFVSVATIERRVRPLSLFMLNRCGILA